MLFIKYMFLIFVAVITFLACLPAPSAHAFTQEECIACHATNSSGSNLYISIQEFQDSIHGSELSCVDCHTSVTGKDHEKDKTAGSVDCNECHDQENMHGSGSEADNRPECYQCHGKHNIQVKDESSSSIHRTRLRYTCLECHPVECGEGGYLSWLPSLQIKSHKKQDFSMAYDRFNCIGCHQGRAAHGEDQVLDEQECHLCHMKLKTYGAVAGYIHPGAHNDHPALFYAAIISQAILFLILLGIAIFAWVWIASRAKDRKG